MSAFQVYDTPGTINIPWSGETFVPKAHREHARNKAEIYWNAICDKKRLLEKIQSEF